MTKTYIILILIVLITYILKNIRKNTKKKSNIGINEVVKEQSTISVEPIKEIEKFPYKRKNILTRSEYAFYMTLIEKLKDKELVICPKVRLEDFIEVTDKKQLLKYRGKIKSRHIDFLLCDSNLRILCAIELDDPLHNDKKAMEIDIFKNKLFKEIEIKLYRIAYNEDKNKRINDILIDLNKI